MPQVNPSTSAPKIVSNPLRLSWRNVILGLFIGTTLIGGGLIAFYYFELKSVSSSAQNQQMFFAKPKETSPSATPVQPRIITDETASWKTDIADFMGVKFSLKYPPEYSVYRSYTADTVFTTNEGEKKFYIVTNRKSIITNWENGDVSLSITVEDNPPSQEGVVFEDSAFAGVSAKRGTWSSEGIGTLLHYTNKQPGAVGKYFTFRCSFASAANNNLKQVCELMASTFKFLP